MAEFLAWKTQMPRPPLVVVDIGYSESGQSCGVWHDGATLRNSRQFYRAIELAAEQLNASLSRDVRPLLVIEAPLSRAHTAKGNPMPRGEFENARRWYVQPGAVTCLAAIRFLESLSTKLVSDVWIAEAFLSNKDEATAHWRDAMEIHAQFWTATPTIPTAADISPLCGLIDGIPEVRVFVAIALGSECQSLPLECD